MNILYLYSELGPYNIPVLRLLVEKYNVTVHVVSWDVKKLKPYSPPEIEGIKYYNRSNFSSLGILELCKSIDPDIVYVSGWMDKGYFSSLKWSRNRNIPVVTGFDDQWVGSFRQRLGVIYYLFKFKHLFSHAWVAGPRQYEFAKKFGFKDTNIIFDLLSCDNEIFNNAFERIEHKRMNYPRTFLYVGNLRYVKGVDILNKAYVKYRSELGGSWNLICVGNGEMSDLFDSIDGVEMRGFLNQHELVSLCSKSGVFILPSRHDQWGVVVHEFSMAGLPLLLSEGVGSKSTLLIDGYNGMSYPDNSIDLLAKRMIEFSDKDSNSLMNMAYASHSISSRISTESSAANLMSIISKNSELT